MAKKPTAKQEESTAVATVAEPTPNALMAVAEGADVKDTRGKEAITKDDITLPRIQICQNNSPEKDEDDPKFIEDLSEGDLFNTLTQQIYGRGPITFAIIRLDKRAMQFKIGPDGKRTKEIVDYNVAWDDPRCEFTTGEDGSTRVKPVATRFYDYLVFLPDTMEAAVISMSNTKFPIGKKLNSLMALRPGAAWKGLYTLGVAKEEKNGNKYFNFVVKLAGATPQSVVDAAESLFTTFQSVNVRVHDEGADPDAEGDATEPVPTDAKVPF